LLEAEILRLPSLRLHRELLTALLSVGIQVPLAVFLGHYYDETVFMITGYEVSAGLNPYLPHVISGVFSSSFLSGAFSSIGDPPLWPLLLGAIYKISYNITQNIFLYNFAIKIPVVVTNIVLAYTVKNILRQQNASEKTIKFAWLFLLFNPFTLLTTTAWGQFDNLIALLCVASLYFLSKKMVKKGALLLSLSVVLKPICFPLLGLPLLFLPKKDWSKMLQYIVISIVMIVFLWILPFYKLGGKAPFSSIQAAAYFLRAGGMTPFSIVELLKDQVTLPSGLGFLGYIWIPAVLFGYYLVYRDPPKTFNELIQKAIGIMLIFFLTFSWLSEPYMNVMVALALLTLSFTKLNFRNFHFLWIITLIFMVFSTNFFQLFFLVSPSIIASLAQADLYIRSWRLIAMFIVVVVFQVFAWRLTIEMFKTKKRLKQQIAR
jgi:hypothetical protein